jgi:radial spoke head protein 9
MSVVVKSLAWAGFVFFHMPSTPYFGHVYVGTGLKNNDLIFMLPN